MTITAMTTMTMFTNPRMIPDMAIFSPVNLPPLSRIRSREVDPRDIAATAGISGITKLAIAHIREMMDMISVCGRE